MLENEVVSDTTSEEIEISEGEQSESAEASKDAKNTKDSASLENDSDVEATEEDSGEESEESEAQEQKRKSKPGAEKRISKLVKQRAEAQRELEYWKRAALEKQESQQESEKQTDKKVYDSDPKPSPDDYDTQAEWLDARDEWRDRQAARKAQEAEAMGEYQKRGQAYKESVETFKQQASDFDEVMEDVDHIRIPAVVRDEIVNSELKAELAYELAKDPEEFARICKLPAVQAIKALTRFEDKILSRKSDSKSQDTETKTSKAPKPLTPVSAKSGAVKKTIFDKGISFSDYERIRKAELKSKQG